MKWGLRNYKTKQTNDTYLGTEPTATCTAQASDLLPFFFFCAKSRDQELFSPYFIPAPFLSVLGGKILTWTSYFKPLPIGPIQ